MLRRTKDLSSRIKFRPRIQTLSSSVGIRVITAKQAVGEIRKCIRRRDSLARRVANATGKRLPMWVGKD